MPDAATPDTALAPAPAALSQAPLRTALPASDAGSSRASYDRSAAAAYARRYWNRACSDGFVALSGRRGDVPGEGYEQNQYPFVKHASGAVFEHTGDAQRPERASCRTVRGSHASTLRAPSQSSRHRDRCSSGPRLTTAPTSSHAASAASRGQLRGVDCNSPFPLITFFPTARTGWWG